MHCIPVKVLSTKHAQYWWKSTLYGNKIYNTVVVGFHLGSWDFLSGCDLCQV
jgi:hypothetical protein